jgi:hypothetical protein
MPFWVNITNPAGCTWDTSGMLIFDIQYTLCLGLNMVSLPVYSTSIMLASDMLADIPACNAVFRWNRSVDCLRPQGFDAFTILSTSPEDFSLFTGHGYWANVDAAGIWIPPNP